MADRIAYAELHCHTNFSFLDGASAPDELVERAVGARADRAGGHGPPGPVRRGPLRGGGRGGGAPPGHRGRDRARSTRPSRIPGGIVVPARRPARRRGRDRSGAPDGSAPALPVEGLPGPAAPGRGPACPAIGRRSRRTCAASATASARAAPRPAGSRRGRLPEPVPARLAGRTWPGRRACRASRQALLAEHAEGLVALSGCRDGRDRPAAPGRRSGRGAGRRRAAMRRSFAARRLAGRLADARPASSSSCSTTSCPTTTGSWPRPRALAEELGPAGRRHERRPLRPARGPRAARRADRDPPRPDARDAGRPAPAGRRVVPEVGRRAGGAAARRPGRRIATGAADGPRLGGGHRHSAGELAAACSVDLGFERYRFPGFAVPGRRDAVLVPRGAVPRGRPAALPPADAGGGPSSSPTSSTSSSGPAWPSSSSSAGT